MKRMIVVVVAVSICLATMLAWAIEGGKVMPGASRADIAGAAAGPIIKLNSSFSLTAADFMVIAKGKAEFVIFGRLRPGADLATVEPQLWYQGVPVNNILSKPRQIVFTKTCQKVAEQPNDSLLAGIYFTCTFNPSASDLNIGKIPIFIPEKTLLPELSGPTPPEGWRGNVVGPQLPIRHPEVGAPMKQLQSPVDIWLPVGTYWFVAKALITDKSPAIAIKTLIENGADTNSDGIPDRILPVKTEDTTGKDTEPTTETPETTDQTGELNTSPVVTPQTGETSTETAAEGEGGGMCTLMPMASANPLGLILLLAAAIPLARRRG